MANRPERIRAGAVALFINDTLQHRGQRFGASVRLDSEDIREIGNTDIVEVSDNVPAVELTLDTNQSGLIRTIASLANREFNWGYVQVKPAATPNLTVAYTAGVYYYDQMKYEVTGAGTINFTADVGGLSAGEQQVAVVEIVPGAAAPTRKLGTATTGTPAIPGTTTGSLKIAEVFLQNGMTKIEDRHVLNRNDDPADLTPHTIELSDFETSYADMYMPVKHAGDNTTDDPISRTIFFGKAYVSRYDANFTAQGAATENFSAETDNLTHFLGDAKQIVVERLQAVTGTGSVTYNLAGTAVALNQTNDHFAPGFCAWLWNPNETTDDKWTRLTENEDFDFSTDGTQFVVTDNVNDAEAVYKVRYCSATGGEFFDILPNPNVNTPQPLGVAKGGHVEIFLSDNLSDRVLRLQSVSMSASLNRDPLYEIGSITAYARPVQFPLPITVNLETTASDLEEWARFANKLSEYTNDELKQIVLSDLKKDKYVLVKIYDANDEVRKNYPEGTVLKDSIHRALKTIKVENLAMTDTNFEIAVEGNATQTFAFKANNLLTWIGPY